MTSRQDAIQRLEQTLPAMSVAERFRVLHDEGIYVGDESVSGHASDDAQTEKVRSWLPGIINAYGIKSVLDAPCGDCRWVALTGFLRTEYVGVDCVPALVEANRARFPKHRFECLDILTDELPRAELVICRDLLIHLSNRDSLRVLERLAATNAKWLITTTFTGDRENSDILSGDFRPVQLQRAPFSLPAPAALCIEHCTLGNGRFADKSLALWPMNEIDL